MRDKSGKSARGGEQREEALKEGAYSWVGGIRVRQGWWKQS